MTLLLKILICRIIWKIQKGRKILAHSIARRESRVWTKHASFAQQYQTPRFFRSCILWSLLGHLTCSLIQLLDFGSTLRKLQMKSTCTPPQTSGSTGNPTFGDHTYNRLPDAWHRRRGIARKALVDRTNVNNKRELLQIFKRCSNSPVLTECTRSHDHSIIHSTHHIYPA